MLPAHRRRAQHAPRPAWRRERPLAPSPAGGERRPPVYRWRSHPARWTGWLGVAVLLGGCPSRFDPRAETLAGLAAVRAADPTLDSAWREARQRFDAGDFAAARQGFERVRLRGDAAARVAALWQARSCLALGEAAAAQALVEPLADEPGDPQIASQARFVLGLALARGEQPARSRPLLLPFEDVIVDGEDATELHAALAAAAAAEGEVPVALVELERFFAGARGPERAFIRAEATRLASVLPAGAVRSLYLSAAPLSLTRAALGPRMLAVPGQATPALASEVLAARERFGMASAAAVGSEALRRAVGLVLPLSGRNRLVGERALRGALLAAGGLVEDEEPIGAGEPGPSVRSPPSRPPPIDLLVRDSASRPERAAAAIDELVHQGVLAVVLSPDRAEAAAAAGRARELALPAFDLSPDDGAGERFRLLRPLTARASALAERALRAGARRLAVLYPDSGFGRKMAEAFAAALQGRGVALLAQLHFDEKATTFIEPARQLGPLLPDAVFVPAAAGQLELIAAQLLATGVTGAHPGRGPGATLYATADGASGRTLARAGRYLQGAVLAPVFSPSSDGPTAATIDRYRGAFGEEPGAADALAYDALSAARAAIERLGAAPPASAAEGRQRLAALVAGGSADGLTGSVSFAADGQRAGPPTLLLVDGDRLRPLP